MVIDWDEVNKVVFPVKDYEDLCRRLRRSLAYTFIHEAYNFTMPELVSYTQQLLGGDARGRYVEYLTKLSATLTKLHLAVVLNVADLVRRTDSRTNLEVFTEQSGMHAPDVVVVLTYLIYWVIPMEKYLSGLIRDDPNISDATKVLGAIGIRTNLELLQAGINSAGCKALAGSSGLPEPVILDLVNRADFSRMPWASKATISNIIGAGYSSLAQLANANPEQLYTDFFRYGKAIGKNLKLGNEIENSYRIAKIIPAVLDDEGF